MNNKERKKDKVDTMRRIANTTDGMIFIKYLIEDYMVNLKPEFDNPNKMYFNLGKQDWVRDLMKLIEDKERFERILITSRFDKKEDMS